MRLEFNSWKRRVNELLENNTGLGIDAFIDIDYNKLWEDDLTPIEAAKKVTKEEFGSKFPELIEI